MPTVNDQIRSASEVICRNIDKLSDQRDLLSQNVLSQMRNLVEGIAVRLYKGTPEAEFTYEATKPALNFVKSNAKFNFLGRFHKLLQKIASHYTLEGDASERLMLKYYEYLLRIRKLLRDECGIEAISNLENFPLNLDPSLREYHEKIAERIQAARSHGEASGKRDRYYIQKTRPFFCKGRIYYEVTFCRAINRVNKFDRIIAFTDIDINDKYSANLTLRRDSIVVLGRTMPITAIVDWEVSIRPCEFDNFARLLGVALRAQTSWVEYRYLMQWLTSYSASLLDVVDMPEEQYETLKQAATQTAQARRIFPLLDQVRRLVMQSTPGCNVLRYLMLRMHNKLLKLQYYHEECQLLSGLNLKYGCIPFDKMPFCTSLPGHNPRYWDLMESLDSSERTHELLARRVKNNVETHGVLYTPEAELECFGEVEELASSYNEKIYYKHAGRKLKIDKKHVFVREYEDSTACIVELLQNSSSSGIAGYTHAVERWLDESPRGIDDEVKEHALKVLFSESRVALIYGAAGTGKSTMVDHISQYFNEKDKLFLAQTNPAIDNLKRKVTAQNSEFRTIASHNYRNADDEEFDILVIDECSTVSNADLLKTLKQTSFELLVLVGDVYQIESIQFGNWFGLIRSFVPNAAVFELTTPFRTKNTALLDFWSKVRTIEDDITESIARNGYSASLDSTLFTSQGKDEIILCLNYDGLYGINNVNRFLQSSNTGAATTWRESTYKVGDPILFFETERFKPVIYNNLKGHIVAIESGQDRIQFDVDIDRSVNNFDVMGTELKWIRDSVVRFSVFNYNISDDDDDSINTIVPFQVAYAVSIHKAQGLEYDSVKIVVTDANGDDVTHSIFYTAVTRARKSLRVFWTPETQHAVLNSLSRTANPKDVAILAKRRGLHPIK